MSSTFDGRNYFKLPPRSPWRWEDRGEVVCWETGETISFREELLVILERMAFQGLGAFQPLLLLLAACRESWRAPGHASTDLCRRLLQAESHEELLRGVLSGLGRVHLAMEKYRRIPLAKAILAEMIFEHAKHRSAAEDSWPILQTLRDKEPLTEYSDQLPPCTDAQLIEFCAALRPGLERLDLDILDLRLSINCDALPEVAPVELPPESGAELATETEQHPADAVRQLLHEMLADPEHPGLAELAQRLLVAAYLPRPLTVPNDLPIGGVSDITNRGTPDRLLVSELAHDDTTLAVRIALNEALYLRREAPPQAPTGRRAILLDTGIRLWGVPRIFATAVGLALLANTDARYEAATFRATDRGLEATTLTTRAGLIEHLGQLHAAPHPAAVLAEFVSRATAPQGDTECVLVTHAEVLSDPEFRLAFQALGLPLLYAATVTREGDFRLWAITPRGQKLLRSATLDLDVLLKAPPGKKPALPLLRAEADPNLPLILSTEPFPLLMSHSIDWQRVCACGRFGAVSASNDGRLLHWKNERHGGLQLTDRLPRGKAWLMEFVEPATCLIVIGPANATHLHLVKVDLERGTVQLVPLEPFGDVLRGVVYRDGVLLLNGQKVVGVYDPSTGAARTFPIPQGSRWHARRFFQDARGWQALAFDGEQVHFEPVVAGKSLQSRVLAALFDRDGCDGPWGLTTDGALYDAATDTVLPHPGIESRRVASWTLSTLSRDGHRMVIREASPQGRGLFVNLQSRETMPLTGDHAAAIEPTLRTLLRQINFRFRFRAIGRSAQGDLVLVSHKGKQIRLAHTCWYNQDPPLPLTQQVGFRRIESPPDTGYVLWVADWSPKHRVFLDSRGLLHVKPTDQPEWSLVLCDGSSAGWCSDGQAWGELFFTGLATTQSITPELKANLLEYLLWSAK